MSEALGLDLNAMLAQAGLALVGTVIIFFIISPIGGYFLFRLLGRVTPMPDTFALLGAAACGFLITFAALMVVLMRAVPPDESNLGAMLLLSIIGALVVTTATAFGIRWMTKRRAAHLEDHTFRVWDEDARARPKNLRRR